MDLKYQLASLDHTANVEPAVQTPRQAVRPNVDGYGLTRHDLPGNRSVSYFVEPLA
jgi:hypothetical protein